VAGATVENDTRTREHAHLSLRPYRNCPRELPDAPDALGPQTDYDAIVVGGLRKDMKRPTGLTVIGILTVAVAALLALGCVASFFVAVMGLTEQLSGDPVSSAIVGMALGGGFSLLILAFGAVALANGIFKLRQWAWSGSLASITAGIGFTLITLFAFRRFVFSSAVLSVSVHLLVLATAAWMLAYLWTPEIRQAFGSPNILPGSIQIRFLRENNYKWLNSLQAQERDFRKRASWKKALENTRFRTLLTPATLWQEVRASLNTLPWLPQSGKNFHK
jgi:hypothetical protein